MKHEDASCLAVGEADGSLVIVRQKTLKKITMVDECHQFPVTGMGFCPSKELAEEFSGTDQLLVTCSADNAMALVQVSSSNDSTSLRMLYAALLLLFTALAALYFFHPDLLTRHVSGAWSVVGLALGARGGGSSPESSSSEL